MNRMLSRAFSKKRLDVQRKVVCEEFKENYINKPYGDVWHKLRELAYSNHPYRWMTIGKELKHVEEATLEDVKIFFHKFYNPLNAILVVAANVEAGQVKLLAEKWFGPIPSGEKYMRQPREEPPQLAQRTLEVKADVPLDPLYKCWHIYPRLDDRYYVADLITDVLGSGASSRFFNVLVKEKKDFEQEKNRLIEYLIRVQKDGKHHFDGKASFSFGKLNAEEWNNMFYKYLNHHLTQFGV